MYRKNTASQFVCFQGVDSSTGGIKSGVTVTVRRCIDGTFAAGGGTVTEDSTNGWYKYAMAQADTNGNNIGLNFTGTGMVPVTINFITTACDPTSTAFGLSLAKTTNITGFNDIAATAIVSSGAITTSGGAVSTVTTATNVTTVNGLAANVITAASMAADASAEIADAVWDEDATGHQTGGTFGQAIGDPGADTNTIFKAVVTDATGATVGVDVSAVLADTGTDGVVVASLNANSITAAAAAADFGTEVGTAVWASGTRTLTANTNLGIGTPTDLGSGATLAANLVDIEAQTDDIGAAGAGLTALASATNLATVDTVVDAIKVQTDKLTFTVANQVDANIQSVNDVTLVGDGSGTPFNV